MSLKAFHVIFITAASALAFGCAAWSLKNYFSPDGRWLDILYAVLASAAGFGLILYERYFLKKLKNVSYL
jgi:hypothetical protein